MESGRERMQHFLSGGEDVTWYISVVCVLGGSTLYYYDYEDDNDISPFNKVWELYSGVGPSPKLEVKELFQ